VQRLETPQELRALLAQWHPEGDRIALVPTMGNLHKGHVSLIKLARELADRVIVSVFVNPTQFGPNEDFEEYPRTLETDALKLMRAGADVLYAPSVETMYPEGPDNASRITVPNLSSELEGASRPGHFAGVASVVCRLFNMCYPNVAVFGQKDYQQFVILKRMARDLHLPVQLVAAPTVRSETGLALSSRNSYLNDAERNTAVVISQALNAINAQLEEGNRDFAALEKAATEQIAAAGLEPDYIAIRDAEDLSMPGAGSLHLVALAAARLGKVRLLDNILIELHD